MKTKIQWGNIYKNKYFLAFVIFLFIILFFDDNNLLERFKLIGEKAELNAQIEYYEQEIEESKRKYIELKTDSKNLEKFAREEYFMKKDKEEIYILVEEED